MEDKMKQQNIFLAIAVVAFLFTACQVEEEPGILVPVTGIELDIIDEQIIEVGDLLKLTATITPDDATEKGIRWVSINNNVAVFSEGFSATVYAMFPGETVIFAVTEHGAFIASCPITVLEP